MHAVLYQNPQVCNRSPGQQRRYQAGPGWNACTGLGSPDGVKLLAALQGARSASGPAPAQQVRAVCGLHKADGRPKGDEPHLIGARQADAHAFGQMRSHILSLYQGAGNSQFMGDDGSLVDCIPIDQQPSLRGARQRAQGRPPPRGRHADAEQ